MPYQKLITLIVLLPASIALDRILNRFFGRCEVNVAAMIQSLEGEGIPMDKPEQLQSRGSHVLSPDFLFWSRPEASARVSTEAQK
jgi:hypothetical protein